MPRKKRELTEKERHQVEALAAYLTQDQIADYLGISRTTFTEIVKRDDDVSVRYKKGKSRAIGKAAKTVMDAIQDGNLTAAFFYLKTQAFWRENAEPSGEQETQPIQISFSRARKKK